jgi:uncharacterized membrane protein YuzA (DUF378 family)
MFDRRFLITLLLGLLGCVIWMIIEEIFGESRWLTYSVGVYAGACGMWSFLAGKGRE